MPDLHIESIGQTGAQYYINNLSYGWNETNYFQACLTRNQVPSGGASSISDYNYYSGSFIYPPSSGNDGYTSWGDLTGLSANTSYTVYGAIQFNDGKWYPAGSYTFSTLPYPPSTPSSISGYGITGHKIRLSWNSSSGATGYEIWASSNGGASYSFKKSTSSTTTDISIDYEYYYYYFAVSAYNAGGYSGYGYSSAITSLDETNPQVDYFYSTQVLSNQISVYAQAYDPPQSGAPSGTYGSGIRYIHFYKNGTYITTQSVNGSAEAYYTYTGLTVNVEYTLEARSEDWYGNLSSIGAKVINVTTQYSRPPDFSWQYSTISQNSMAEVDIRDWNNLCDKIDLFRLYKGLSEYGFTEITGVGDIHAWQFNQLVNGCSGLTGYMSNNVMPSIKSTNDDFYASYLNNVVTSINSIP